MQDALSEYVDEFATVAVAEDTTDEIVSTGLATFTPEFEDEGPEPVTDAAGGYEGGSNDPCDGESTLPFRFRTAEGQVDLTTTADMTDEEIESMIRHARMLNSYIARYGPIIPQPTTGQPLGKAARIAAKAETTRSDDANENKYTDRVVGHGPDASFANGADSPCGWESLTTRVNSRIGSHWGPRSTTQSAVTHVTVDGVLPGEELLPISNLPL